ncbi:MAG: ABC transporter ATP-binding protein [Patescibacteria group bacterium]|nr:ABC transporter ATP-binding protein [Patescibacteria group bacterium]
MKDFWRAAKLASKNKKLTFLAIFVALLTTLISLIQPLVYKEFFDLIDDALAGGSSAINSNFWYIVLAYTAVIFARDLSNSWEYYAVVKWWVESKKILTQEVFTHLHNLSLGYFERNSTGKIKERVDKGINDLNSVMESIIMEVAPQFIFIIVATVFLFRTNYVFGLILLVSIPAFIFISTKHTKNLIKIQDKYRNASEKLSGSFTESIINARTIKSFATEEKHRGKIMRIVSRVNFLDLLYTVRRISMNLLRFLVVNLAQISILGLGTYWTITNKITLGDLILVTTYTNRSIQPLWSLTWIFDRVVRDMRSVRRVFELLDTEPEIKDAPNAKKLQIRQGSISFRDVSFRYEDKKQKKVVSGFTLDIPAGQTIAFVGKSGVGKSTLIKLLLRFYDIQKGSILIDNQDITKVTQKSLRENIGVVMQDSILFNDTAENNIKYGGRAVPKKNILIASKAANAHEFVEKLPKKYDTVVGERGVKLSGGEQQRINIARAFLKNPHPFWF